jgi:hypothetical protein
MENKSITNMKLTDEQIELIANPKFSKGQVILIKNGLNKGLTTEQVKFYAKPEFCMSKMGHIKNGLLKGLSFEQVEAYADKIPNDFKEDGFCAFQIDEIIETFKQLPIEQAKLCVNLEFDTNQIKEIRRGFLYNGLTMEQVKLYAKPEYNERTMEKIRENYFNK